MSAYPLMIDGASLSAVVIGGGQVATRKAIALLESGARVRVVAPGVTAELEAAQVAHARLEVVRASYTTSHLDDAALVIAATDDASLNARIATDARAAGQLVNVVSAPELGTCVTPAVHRVGDVVVAVTTGGVPAAARRIRDAIAEVIDARHADAISQLAELRRSLLHRGLRDRWTEASAALIGDDFMSRAESPEFSARVAEWR